MNIDLGLTTPDLLGYGSAILWILLGMVVITAVGFVLLILLRYKIPVLVFEVVGDGVLLHKKRGGLVRDKDKAFKFKIFGVKQSIHPPPADAYIFTKGSKKTLLCVQNSPTDYSWLNCDLGKGEERLVPIEQDVLFWYINDIESDHERYANEVKWWQNPYILGIATMGLCMVVVIVTFKYAQTWAESGALVYQQAVENAKELVGQVVK